MQTSPETSFRASSQRACGRTGYMAYESDDLSSALLGSGATTHSERSALGLHARACNVPYREPHGSGDRRVPSQFAGPLVSSMCVFIAVSVRDGWTRHMTGYGPERTHGPTLTEHIRRSGHPGRRFAARERFRPPPTAVSVRPSCALMTRGVASFATALRSLGRGWQIKGKG